MVHGKIVLKGELELRSPALIGSGRNEVSDIDVLVDPDGTPFIPATSLIGVLRQSIRDYKLTERSLKKLESLDELRKDPTSSEILTRLKMLKNREYQTRTAFLKELETAIGKECALQYKDAILKVTELGEDRKRFWGFTSDTPISPNEQEQQSALRCADLTCVSSSAIFIRDGIKIDHVTGIVKEGGKYDYQVIERGAKFKVHVEAEYSETTKSFTERMMKTIGNLLAGEQIQIGAKTNNGLGKVKLLNHNVYLFDFFQKEDVLRWLKQDFSVPVDKEEWGKITLLPVGSRTFCIHATFDLKHSVIVRSYPSTSEEPDAVNVKSGGEYVIPGSSLKGAIRSRAERIVNTLGKSESETILTNLFGDVDDESRSSEAKKGKVKVEETLLLKFISELHHRIKIDRFTGGTIESALFETMPVYPNLNDKVVEITITVQDYEDYEAGLLLLVLKDLWTGDLAVGGEKNIGRGVFQGCRAKITWNGKTTHIEQDLSQLSQEDREHLQHLVSVLVNYPGSVEHVNVMNGGEAR